MTKILPFKCYKCGNEFEAEKGQGGRCTACGKIVCPKHLRLTYDADRVPYCSDCANDLGATKKLNFPRKLRVNPRHKHS